MLTAIKGRWEAENSGLPLATWAHLNLRSLRKRATKKFDHAVANHTFKLLIGAGARDAVAPLGARGVTPPL